MSYRIGIDVGGTMTDAVIIDAEDKLAAKTKVANSEDIVTGIRHAVEYVIRESGISPSDVDFAMLGTTQVTNAIIERKGLNKVLSIRIGAPAVTGVKPLASWPSDLAWWGRAAVAVVHGGHEFDGRTISRLDESEVARIARESIGKVEAVAITSVFSPISAAHEEKAAEIVRDVMGEIPISMSHQIGSIGLLERENATILNAMVTRVARRVVHTFAEAMKAAGVHAHLYLAQNDGTLMNLDYAQHYPIFTVACGPTNSMRGASFLAGLSDAIVVDIGGTSTDVGILVKGYPRESALAVEVGGVRTNFRMPDLVSVGIGGGQNENLVAWRDGIAVASVPDLIIFLDPEAGEAIPTERLHYGQRVVILNVEAPPIMTSPEALNVWGPEAFGYADLSFWPVRETRRTLYGSVC